ncbi:MAG: hypothetical protein WC091_18330, partial [Sulfuricellaceae bacterium]
RSRGVVVSSFGIELSPKMCRSSGAAARVKMLSLRVYRMFTFILTRNLQKKIYMLLIILRYIFFCSVNRLN